MSETPFKLNIRAAGDWELTERVLRDLAKQKKFMDQVVAAEAKHAAKLVRQNLNTKGKLTGTPWPRLKRMSLKLKRTKTALRESGELAAAIEAVQVQGGKWFVGVASQGIHKGRGGTITLARLAATHETGATIVQTWDTKQMRAFFALLAKSGVRRRTRAAAKKKSRKRTSMTITIRIPARPFIFPVLDKLYASASSDLEQRIMKRVESALKLPWRRKASKPK